jgi:hypothetical protein
MIDFLVNMAKRMRNPALAAKADELISDSLPYLATNARSVDDAATFASTHQWLRDSAQDMGSYWSRLKQEIHSPDMVIGDVPGGKAILDAGTTAQLEKGKFLDPIMKEYSVARGGIKQGSDEAERVFGALEAPALVGQLNEKEKRLHTFLKNQYNYTHQTYSMHLVDNDQNAYNKVLRMTQRTVDPAELVTLTPGEKEMYDFTKRKIGDYAPHLFDREQLAELFQGKIKEKLAKMGTAKVPQDIEKLAGEAREYEDALKRVTGGDPLSWEGMPKEFVFRHEMVRGKVPAEGFHKDAIKSFNNYIFSMAKKMYDEPALQTMKANYDQVPLELRPYTKWFIRDFAGYNQKNVWDDLAGQISSFEYMRTLGLNTRSPLVNLTQQFNTVVDAGVKDAAKGYMKLFTKEGQDLWDKSGLAIEVPHAFTEELSPYANKMDKLKRITGFFFNKAEEYNRKHAFLTYLAKYEGDPNAFQKAIEGVHKTQFQYGKMGMPKLLRTPVGKVGLQFSSYPIKQAEFLYKLAKEDPKKLLVWIGGTVGANYTLQETLGIDLSNALGFGINTGEAIQTLRDATKGEFDMAWEHAKLSLSSGGGMLPGLGPAVTGAMKVAKGFGQGKGVEALKTELTPIQLQRITDLARGWENKNLATGKGNLPVLKGSQIFGEPYKEVMSEEPAWKSMVQAFGPQLTERTKRRFEEAKALKMDTLDSQHKQEIARALVSGDSSVATKLIKKYKVIPTTDAIKEELLRKNLPRERRARYIKQMQRQQIRELLD